MNIQTDKSKHNDSGMVTVIFIGLLAIMMILVTAECSALLQLHREVKLLEKRQIKRLASPAINSIVLANLEIK
jgi:hypothetical protein